MADNKRIQFLLEAENKTKEAFKEVNDNLEKSKINIDKIADVSKTVAKVSGIAFGAIATEVGLAMNAYADSEAQLAKVDAILGTLSETILNASGGMEELRGQIDEISEQNIKLGFDDEDTAESLAKLTSATGDFTEAQELNNLAMDLARYKNIDLGTATEALMKMNAGSARELKALGIEVEDNMTKEQMFGVVMEKTAGQAENYAGTMKGKMEIMRLSMQNVQEAIGQGLQPAFEKLATILMPIIEKISTWISKNPELVANILLIAGAITGLLLVLGTLGIMLPGIIAVFSFLISPIGLVTLAIIALIAAGVWLYMHWEEVKNWAITIWTEIKDWFVSVMTSIQETIVFYWDSITAYFNSVFEAIRLVWTTVWTTIRDFIFGIWTSIKNSVNDAFTWIVSKFKEFTAPLTTAWNALWETLGTTVTNIWEGVKNTIKSSINWIIDKINSIIESVNSVMQAGAGAIGIKMPALPTIPRLADGGIVKKPTLAMIGEAGPEAVVPLGGGMAGAGVGGITINLTGNTFIGREGIAEEIGNDIINVLKASVKI